MNRLAQVVLAPADADDDGISLSQTPGAAGNLTITGALATAGVATLDIPRRILLTTGADETSKTFTVTGTDRYGRAQTETITGVNNTTVSGLKDFKTVSQIAVSAATAGAIKVGTGGKVSSQWLPVDRVGATNLGFDIVLSGTANYTVEHTFEDPFSSGVGVQAAGAPTVYLNPFPHATIAAQSTSKDGAYINQPITAVRLTINTYSSGATLTGNFAPGPMRGT